MEYFVIYDVETGAVRLRGMGPVGIASQQLLAEGCGVLIVDAAALLDGNEIDLDLIRDNLVAVVNTNAGAFRLRFITDVPGQQASYLTKEEEAKAWTAGADMVDFPFLAAEAEYTGMPVADIAALVLATASAWRNLAAKIEGRRRGAMVELAAATNIAQLVRAASIDWAALAALPVPVPATLPAS